MRLFALTTLTMIAFAANSVLNRLALAEGDIGATAFGTVRLIAGAVTLAGLAWVTRGRLKISGNHRVVGVLGLLTYIFGFSFAYNALDAGLGALVLFGMVQVTMFGGALMGGERPPVTRWIGTGMAFTGLAWLLWPGSATSTSLVHGVLMAVAGMAWGVYSLVGRKSGDALQSTAANFILAAPVGLVLLLIVPGALVQPANAIGIGLAILSGAVTSGLGYALWYSVLPRLAGSIAAVAQLTVPVIAILGGVLFLSETVTSQLLLATAVVLGGVLIAVLTPGKTG